MKTILLIEDERMIRDIYITKLKQFGNFVILEAITPSQAQKILDKQAVDFIILDIILPQEDGLSYLKRLRKNNINIPVVILSNLEGKEYRNKAEKLKVKKYILKANYTPSEAVELIKEYL